ncbi:hypothetical protein ACHAXA_006432 [Cyclostephanos tholiformis]|uniref:Uncharacterized protein n=1 Tax=Cyclostephanos tholiformis TaxID=382380 RepID=A0ABD3RD31_9STRA
MALARPVHRPHRLQRGGGVRIRVRGACLLLLLLVWLRLQLLIWLRYLGHLETTMATTTNTTTSSMSMSTSRGGNGGVMPTTLTMSSSSSSSSPSPPYANSTVEGGGIVPLTIVTGANSPFFGALRNLVGSVRYWCPPSRCRIAVFNLGLTDDEINESRAWCGVRVHWSDGYHGADPNTYAFKPNAIYEAVTVRYGGAVLWLDAGSTVTGRIYDAVVPHMLDEGAFLVQGQDLNMVPWVHPLMFEYLGANASDFDHKHSYSGNTVGFVNDSETSNAILPPWRDCASDSRCISPPGSDKGNHRYDQAALSVIAYAAESSRGLSITPRTDLLAASSGQLNPCTVESDMVVWTSRGKERCYADYIQRGCEEGGGGGGGDVGA